MDNTNERPDEPEDAAPGRAADMLSFMIDGIASQYALLATVHARVASMMNMAVAAASRNEHLLVHTDSPGTSAQQITELTRRALVAEIATAARLSERMVSSMLDESQSLANELPDTLGALRDGAIGYQHARQLIDQASTLEPHDRKAFEDAALRAAKSSTPPQFRQSARKIRERMYPETLEERRTRAEKDRRVEFIPGNDGMAWLSLYSTAATTLGIVTAAHETAQRLKSSGDDRTQRQIAADVVVDAVMSGLVPPGAEEPTREAPAPLAAVRPTVHVTVPVLTLLAGARSPPSSRDTARSIRAWPESSPPTPRALSGSSPAQRTAPSSPWAAIAMRCRRT